MFSDTWLNLEKRKKKSGQTFFGMSLMSEKKQNGFKLAFGDGNEGVFCEISLQFVRFRTMG
jgi:hypothetical protein